MKTKQLKILFGIIMTLLVALCFITFRNINGYMNEVESIRQTNKVIILCQELLSTAKDAETGHRGYQITNDSTYLTPYINALKIIPQKLKELDSLIVPKKGVKKDMYELDRLLNRQLNIIRMIMAEDRRDTATFTNSRIVLLSEGKINMDLLREHINQMIRTHENLRDQSIASESGFQFLTPFSFLITALIAIGSILLLFSRSLIFIEERNKKTQELQRTLKKLSEEIVTREYAETLVRNILNNSLDGIQAFKSVRNEKGEIIDFEYLVVNEAAAQILEQPINSFNANTLLSVFPKQEAELLQEYIKVVETSETFKSEIQFEVADKKLWFMLAAVKFMDGFVVTFSDITESKNNALQIQQFVHDLKRSNDDLEQFAFVASHDLQEPLRKIRSFGDLLVAKYQEELGDQGQDYIRRMQKAATRMHTLIVDLLEFSRVTRTTDAPSAINMNMLLAEVTENLSNQISREAATVLIEPIPEILAIDGQIRRLFQNIISNGIKFRKSDTSPIIEVCASQISSLEAKLEFGIVPKHERYVRIVVSDNGIGFEPHYQEQIFNIFQRLHGRTTFEGTGIGLAICRKIAMYNDGALRAVGTPNVGAQFIIILPAIK